MEEEEKKSNAGSGYALPEDDSADEEVLQGSKQADQKSLLDEEDAEENNEKADGDEVADNAGTETLDDKAAGSDAEDK